MWKNNKRSIQRGIFHGIGIFIGLSLSALLAVTLHSFKTNEILEAEHLNNNFNALNESLSLLNDRVTLIESSLGDCSLNEVKLVVGAGQSISENIETIVNFGTEVYDPQNMHAPGNNYVTIVKSGTYLIQGKVSYTNTPHTVTDKGWRQLQLIRNNITIDIPVTSYADVSTLGAGLDVHYATVEKLNAGDVIQLRVSNQTQGNGPVQLSFSSLSVKRLCSE